MRLIALFLLCSLAAAYWIDDATTHQPPTGQREWPAHVYERQEGRNCPLYYPSDTLR